MRLLRFVAVMRIFLRVFSLVSYDNCNGFGESVYVSGYL